MADGRLPNFTKTKGQGGTAGMRTTFPALRPWSGLHRDGGKSREAQHLHFGNRDIRTYAPELSSEESDTEGRGEDAAKSVTV